MEVVKQQLDLIGLLCNDLSLQQIRLRCTFAV